MKKRYKKILILLSLCLSLFIGLTVSSHAYYYDSDTGNLESSNLWRYDSTWSNSSTDNRSSFQFCVQVNGNDNIVLEYISSNGNHYYTFTLPNNTSTISFKHNGSTNDLLIVDTVSISDWLIAGNTYTISFDVNGFNCNVVNGINLSNIMLNTGSSALVYEPYGVTFYSQSNYDNYGASQYSQGYTDGFNSIYNSLVDVNLSEHITGIGCGIYNSTGTTFVQNGTITSSYFENSYYYFNINPVIDGNYYIIPISFDNNYVFSSFRWSPNRFTSPSLIINGVTYDSSTVSYNGSTYGWDNLNVNLDSAVNSVEFKFKINSNFEGVNLYINGKNLEIATALESYQIGYDNGQTVGYQNGYSEGFVAGSQSVTTDNTNFQKLIWTIGSTPFESFKTIWDVDVMGLNISGIILGGLMALLVLYLIKKIWK